MCLLIIWFYVRFDLLINKHIANIMEEVKNESDVQTNVL